MIRVLLLLACLATPTLAQQATPAEGAVHAMAVPAVGSACAPEHAAMGHCLPNDGAAPPRSGPPAAAFGSPLYAADQIWGADRMLPARRAIYAEHGTFRGGAMMLDRLENHARDGRNGYAWEGAAWYGGDYDRVWLKSEGEGSFGRSVAAADAEALWGHALNPWFDLQAGVRYEMRPGPGRAQLVLGVQGVAPYWFELGAAAFLSGRGDLTARVEVDYDQRITSKLILQPRIEMDLSAQAVRATGARAGVSSVAAGLRLRYELVPEFAPYVGVEYDHDFDDAAGRATVRRAGGLAFVAGVRAWF